jgi:predicted acyltransferase
LSPLTQTTSMPALTLCWTDGSSCRNACSQGTWASAAGSFVWLGALRPLVGPVIGTHGALVAAGALLGVLLRSHLQEGGSGWRFAARVLGYAAALGVAGVLLRSLNGVHPAFIISKNHATVPWGLVCSALTVAAWVAIFVLADLLAFRRWPRSFAIAGENPLVAYLMAPFLVSVFALTAPLFGGTNFYDALGATTGVGLVRSAVFAWAVVRLSGWMRSRGVRIQL